MNDFNKRTGWLAVRALFSLPDFLLHPPHPSRGARRGQTGRAGHAGCARAHDAGLRLAGPHRAQDGRGGRRPNGGGGGGSDLDEMWRDFNQRFAKLFERRGSGGPGSRPRPGKNGRGARIGVGIVIGALIAGYAGSGTFVVQQGQKGVVLQLGQYSRTVDPGVYWRLPWPFGAHRIVDVGQVRSVDVGSGVSVPESGMRDASVLTHDGGVFDVYFTVQYQVTQPADYLLLSTRADQVVTQAAQAAVRAIVGARGIGDMLDQERSPLLPAQIADAIQRSLDASQTGLTVRGVTLRAVQAPDLAQAAFADATNAHQERERAKRDAQAQAGQLLPAAQADATRMIDEAKTYSERVVTQAQGDAERFTRVYEQYAKAPAIVRERLYLDTMQDIYSNTTKVFVDSKSSQNLIYLPLDRIADALRQRTATGAAVQQGTGAAVAPAGMAAAVSGAGSAGGVGGAGGASSAGSVGGANGTGGAGSASSPGGVGSANGMGNAASSANAANATSAANIVASAGRPGNPVDAGSANTTNAVAASEPARSRERQTGFQ